MKKTLFFAVLFAAAVLFFFEDNSYNQTLPTQIVDINRCFMDAGARYGVHPNLLWAITKIESNFNPYALNKNANGSYDIGIMQINSSWIPVLKTHGLKDERYLWDPCYNIQVGAWVLSQCIAKFGYTWEAVGCYNATSKVKRIRYSQKVWKELKPYIRTE